MANYFTQRLFELLREKQFTIAVSESVTGGAIAKALTDIPGISVVFLGGVVAYSPFAKIHILGVPKEMIEKLGTVDPKIAETMAEKTKEIFKSDIAIATTGIAGPDPIEGKPVGLVYIGITIHEKTTVFEHEFQGERNIIRDNIVVFAFKHCVELLEGG